MLYIVLDIDVKEYIFLDMFGSFNESLFINIIFNIGNLEIIIKS